VVIGHSLGEFAGACIAGILSVPDALELIYTRSSLMDSVVHVPGSMAAVFAPRSEVEEVLEKLKSSSERPLRVWIATENAPKQVVIGGEHSEVVSVLEVLEARGMEHKMMAMKHAFHTPLMSEVSENFFSQVEALGISYKPPEAQVFSSVEGYADSDEVPMVMTEYWARHISRPVNFLRAAKNLVERGKVDVVLEIGTHNVLTNIGKQVSTKVTWLPSMIARRNSWHVIFLALSSFFNSGYRKINLEAIAETMVPHPDVPFARSLPKYPFKRTKLWWDESQLVAKKKSGNFEEKDVTNVQAVHETGLLSPISGPRSTTVESNILLSPSNPKFFWMEDHRIHDVVVLPGNSFPRICRKSKNLKK
jgi:acyl transferase domain-containing protein